MIKLSISDILAILRRFEVATDDNFNREIDQVVRKSPDDQSLLVGLRFKKTRFFILFDHRAGDDIEYITQIIEEFEPEINGALIINPQDSGGSFGLPFKGKEVYLYRVDTGKTRLDIELTRRHPKLSRSTIQKYIKNGHVQVNKDEVTQPKHEVTSTDDIVLRQIEPTDFSEQSLPILYIDDNVIVVNKPAGILTHSKGALNDEFTVAEFFRRHTTFNIDSNRPGIIHRLDRDTSGVIIGARNPQTAELLQEQFANRKVSKVYAAITDGIPKNDTAIIELPIGRNPSHPSMFRVDSKGKSATTKYEVLAADGTAAFVKLMPKTGRTHQLRVHMSYLGTPIKGDVIYGKPSDRLYLHAYSLEVTIPQGERTTFTAPLPKDFTDKFKEVEL